MDAGGYITAMAGVHMAGGLDGKMEHTVAYIRESSISFFRFLILSSL